MNKRCCASKWWGVLLLLLLLRHTFPFFVSVAGSQASYVNQNGEEESNIHVEDHGQKSNDTFMSSYGVYYKCALHICNWVMGDMENLCEWTNVCSWEIDWIIIQEYVILL